MDKVRASLPRGTPIEIWFQDEVRIGQKNKITRRWAKRGTRPSAPHDQRTKSAYIFGAICPQEGKAAGLVLPFCNTDTMNLHLAEIALHIAPGAHAVLLMDQAGCSQRKKAVNSARRSWGDRVRPVRRAAWQRAISAVRSGGTSACTAAAR